MKFRLIRITKITRSLPHDLYPAKRRILRAKGRDKLRRVTRLPDPIEAIDLGDPRAGQSKRKRYSCRRVLSPIYRFFRRTAVCLFTVMRSMARGFRRIWMRLRTQKRKKTIHPLPVLSGMLIAALLVSVLSAGGVLFGLFGGFARRYETVLIPNFVGKDPSHVLSENDNRFHLILQYENNPDVPSGIVITQIPRGGVTRRIYEQNGRCTVTLTISRHEDAYHLDDLSGYPKRDATLILLNRGIRASVSETYSDTVARGEVLSTHPTAGSPLREGDSVTLYVSLGKQILRVSVPSLLGKSESDAVSLLRAVELNVGSVSYRTHTSPAGSIIEQDPPPHTTVKIGEEVNYVVSIGNRYDLRVVPDLYGMSEKDAVNALREQGLTVGAIYPLSHAAPRGTVIVQSPVAGTPITSSTVTVDLYVSS